jgi:pentatricopeptide repeat protein
MNPPPAALYLMMQAEIQEALTMSIRHVLGLYHRFRSLVQQDRDPLMTRLAKDPIVWNAFLYAFCQKKQFESASQVIKDMTNGGPQPNIYTWNIFMQAFFKTGQVEAAERVFKILRSRGIDPDQFTQGTLLRGYAKARLIDRIGETMLHVKSEDEMAPDLLRALAAIPERNKLMYTLEKARVHKDAQAQEKAREEAEVEERRWKLPDFAKAASEADPFAEPPAQARLPRIRIRARKTYQAGVPEEPTLPVIRFSAPKISRRPIRVSIHGRSTKPGNESWRKE